MQFLNLEYKTRPAPQAVKRKKEKKRRSETNLMQCARPDDAYGDERRAGTPRERGREGEGGEADDNGSNHNNGNKRKRRPKRRRTGETDKNNDRTEKRGSTTNHHDMLLRTHSEPLRLLRNRSLLPKQIFLPKKILQTFSKDDPLFPKIRGGVAPIRGVAVNRFPEERSKAAVGTVATGAARDLCGGLPVVQPRPTIPSGGGETTRRGW